MKEKWWEQPTCFLCDWWWAILLAVIVGTTLFLSRGMWIPYFGTQEAASTQAFIDSTPPSNTATTSATLLTPSPDVTQAGPSPEPNSWSIFNDTEIGYTFRYPSNWSISPILSTNSSGDWESVVLSNGSENPSLQMMTPDETARLSIINYDRNGANQIDWVFSNWSWINGQISESTVGDNIPALTARFSVPTSSDYIFLISWIEHGNDTIVITAQVRPDNQDSRNTISRILESFRYIN